MYAKEQKKIKNLLLQQDRAPVFPEVPLSLTFSSTPSIMCVHARLIVDVW